MNVIYLQFLILAFSLFACSKSSSPKSESGEVDKKSFYRLQTSRNPNLQDNVTVVGTCTYFFPKQLFSKIGFYSEDQKIVSEDLEYSFYSDAFDVKSSENDTVKVCVKDSAVKKGSLAVKALNYNLPQPSRVRDQDVILSLNFVEKNKTDVVLNLNKIKTVSALNSTVLAPGSYTLDVNLTSEYGNELKVKFFDTGFHSYSFGDMTSDCQEIPLDKIIQNDSLGNLDFISSGVHAGFKESPCSKTMRVLTKDISSMSNGTRFMQTFQIVPNTNNPLTDAVSLTVNFTIAR